MKDSLFSTSFSRFKKNPASYIAVGAFCGLFFILAATLSFLDVSFAILAIPLVVFPFMFASHVACYYLDVDQPITISAVSRYFFGFFNPQFRSSFRGIKSFLTSLAVYFGAMIVVYIVFYGVYSRVYGETFTSAFSNLVQLYSSTENTNNDLLRELNANNGFLLTFFMYVSTLPIPLAIMWFIYSVSFNSISVYYRLNVRGGTASLIRLAINETYANCRRKMRIDWFKLNWPTLALSLLGSIGGGLIAHFLIRDITLLPAIVILGSVALLLFFLPIYFSNMEVIYSRYIQDFKKGNKMAVEAVLARIQTSIDLSEEERKQLEESFKDETKEEE